MNDRTGRDETIALLTEYDQKSTQIRVVELRRVATLFEGDFRRGMEYAAALIEKSA